MSGDKQVGGEKGKSEAKVAQGGPLANFKPSRPTIWANHPPVLYEVRSLKGAVELPMELQKKESLGKLRLKGIAPDSKDRGSHSPSEAAAEYRRIKRLPEDWPVQVSTLDARQGHKVIKIDEFPAVKGE